MKKMRVVALAIGVSAVMSSQACAVTYLPNPNDNINPPREEMLPLDEFVKEDVEKVLNFYSTQEGISVEEFTKYDVNGDGFINSIDASLIQDSIK